MILAAGPGGGRCGPQDAGIDVADESTTRALQEVDGLAESAGHRAAPGAQRAVLVLRFSAACRRRGRSISAARPGRSRARVPRGGPAAKTLASSGSPAPTHQPALMEGTSLILPASFRISSARPHQGYCRFGGPDGPPAAAAGATPAPAGAPAAHRRRHGAATGAAFVLGLRLYGVSVPPARSLRTWRPGAPSRVLADSDRNGAAPLTLRPNRPLNPSAIQRALTQHSSPALVKDRRSCCSSPRTRP